MTSKRPEIVASTACRKHAADLLKGAHALVEARLPHLAYHLAALAIEEIGRAFLLRSQLLGPEDSQSNLDKKFDDHVAKLMWGLWLPAFASATEENRRFEDARKLAMNIHQTRLAGLYVNVDAVAKDGPPIRRITKKRADDLIRLAEARLALQKDLKDEGDLGVSKDDLAYLWGLRHDEQTRWAWNKESFKKLRELGDMRAWVAWIREREDEARKLGQEMLRQEMQRQQPTGDEAAEPKWRFKIRLHSPSHSVRQKALNVWNAPSHVLTLGAVSGHPNEMLVTINVPKGVHLTNVYRYAWGLARQFVTALCIGSTGFFWWEAEHDPDVFYEEVEDLEQPKLKVSISRNPSLRVTWRQRDTIKDVDVGRMALVFYAIGQLPRERMEPIFGRYVAGLTFLAKSNAHFAFERDTFASFQAALRNAITEYGDWDGESGTFVSKLSDGLCRFFEDGVVPEELVELARRDPGAAPVPTLDQAAMMKLICDLYLINAVEARHGRDHANSAIGDEAAAPS